jgi:hypothetical protein
MKHSNKPVLANTGSIHVDEPELESAQNTVVQPERPTMTVLQRAWAAASHATRQQFAEANAIELRDLLAIVAKNARDLAAQRAIERLQAAAPAPEPYPELPAKLDRSKPRSTNHPKSPSALRFM